MELRVTHDAPSIWRIRFGGQEPRLTIAFLQALDKALQQAEHDRSCRALILQGEKGMFCQGLDLNEALESELNVVAAGIEDYRVILTRLRCSRKVVIAMVDGLALGGGLGLAAAADLLLTTSSSRFGLPEVTLGLIPSLVIPVLAERLSIQKCLSLALTGVSIDAPRALGLGLVDDVASDGEELEKSLRSYLRLILRGDPEAISLLKRFCRVVEETPLPRALCFGAIETTSLLSDPIRMEAIARSRAGESMDWIERLPATRRALS